MSSEEVPLLAVVLVLAAGGSARLTRLITTDVITFPLRKFVVIRSRVHDSRFFAFVEKWQRCPWCAGLWASALVHAVGAAAWIQGGTWLLVYMFGAAALTANLVWAMVAQHWDSFETAPNPEPAEPAEPAADLPNRPVADLSRSAVT